MLIRYKTVFLFLALSFLAPTIASATCSLKGYPIRVTTYPDRTYIMFRIDKHADNYYYQGYSSDTRVESGMWTALKGGSRVLIRGTAASCPAVSGAGGYQIGVIDRIGTGY